MFATLKSFFGSYVLPVLPSRVARGVKRIYYLRLIRRTDATQIPAYPVLQELVGAGDSVADIGANVGVYTKAFSTLVGEGGRVRSIEPIPTVFDLLCYNARKAGWQNVEPIHSAVSDVAGNAVMVVPRFASGAENYYRARIVDQIPDGTIRHVTVPVRPLDEVLTDWIGKVSFIKCDVEGHELQCLRGAARIISDNPPAWFVEVSGDPDAAGSTAYEAMELMTSAGYRVYWWNGEALVERQTGDHSIDYFFLMPKHVEKLKAKGLLR